MGASSNITGPNLDTYNYSVISLCYVSPAIFLYELNNIETLTGDIINAYLTARTTGNIVFNAGTNFSLFGQAGHLLLINTALYIFNSSGARFHSRLSNAQTALVLVPSMVGCDIWVQNEGCYYSYVACCCNYPIIVHKYPDHVFESIRLEGFNIK